MLKALCPSIFAQLLADTATSGQPSADPAPALWCLWCNSGTQSGQQLKGGQDRWKRWFDKGLAGGESISPIFHCLKSLCCYLRSPGHPSTTEKRISGLQHAPVLTCCLTAMHTKHNTLDTLLLSQLSSDIPNPLPTNPSQQASLSDVLRTGKLRVYLCLSIMLFVEGQINHKLKLIGMQNYLKNAN